MSEREPTFAEIFKRHWRQMLVLAVVSAVLGYWAGGLSS